MQRQTGSRLGGIFDFSWREMWEELGTLELFQNRFRRRDRDMHQSVACGARWEPPASAGGEGSYEFWALAPASFNEYDICLLRYSPCGGCARPNQHPAENSGYGLPPAATAAVPIN